MHRGNRVCDRFRAAWEVHLGAVETSRDPVMSLEDLTFQSEEEEGEWEWEWGGYAPPNSRRSSSDSDEPAYLELLFLQGLLMQFDRIYLNNRLMDREVSRPPGTHFEGLLSNNPLLKEAFLGAGRAEQRGL